jgi:hypothetical protein
LVIVGKLTTDWVNPQGASTIDISGPVAFRDPRLSPDGSLVAVNEIAPAVGGLLVAG